MPIKRWLFLSWTQALLIFIFALLLRARLIFNNSFDGLYGQDAYAYFGYAREMANALAHVQVPPPFYWPLGYPLLLNAGWVLLGQSIAAAQLTTLVCGAAAASFTLLLTRELLDHGKMTAGIVAGAVIALSGQAVQSSIVVMADAPALLWSALSAWLLSRYFRTHRLVSLLISTVALVLALITRWQSTSLVLAWFAAFAFHIWTSSRQRHSLLKQGGVALLVFLLILTPQLYYERINSSEVAGSIWAEGWSPLNAFRRTFDNVDGHFDYALPPALFYAQPLFHPAYLFPLLTPFAVIGAWALVQAARGLSKSAMEHRLRRLNKAVAEKKTQTAPYDPVGNESLAPGAVLIIGWIAATYFFLAGIPYENFRFGLGMFVPVATLTGIGVARAWQAFSLPSRTRQVALSVILLAAGVGSFIWQPRVLQPIVDIKQRERNQLQALVQTLPPSATVFSFGINGALEAYNDLHTVDVWSEPLTEIRAQARAATSFLFLDTANVETQWHGFRVEQNYHALKEAGELQELRVIGGWTLFQIKIKD